MFNTLRNFIDYAIAIDLGTANTLIATKTQGVILNEPTVVAYKKALDGIKKVVAVGNEAKKMLGRAPGGISVIRPLKDGVIADLSVTEEMLRHYIHKIKIAKLWTKRPRVVVCVPCGANQIERRAIIESVKNSGAKSVQLISEGMAAAMGADCKISDPTGVMVVDIGGGTSEIIVISMGEAVYAHSEKIGGDKFDEAIVQYIRRHFGCLIGLQTAEMIKLRIGSAYPISEVLDMSVTGRALHSGTPRQFTITSNEVLEALEYPLNALADAICHAIEQIPPELVGDIAKNGIVLTGGGALLNNLAPFLTEILGVEVRIAVDPLTCVVKGCCKALNAANLAVALGE